VRDWRCKARANGRPYTPAVMRRLIVRLLVLGTFLLAGCVSESRPADCDDDAKTIHLTIKATSMEPNDAAACTGQEVTVILDPDVDGVLHVHGLDSVLPAASITAGEQLRLEFTADRTGQFPIELHAADDPQGVVIGILTVYDR
jgi:outer membrane murein-binding lipoprotein Lpp